jgi:hypothetical protein
MIFTLIGLIIILYSFRNFKKAFMSFLIFNMFLNTNLSIISIPGVPLLSLETVMIIVFCLHFWREKKTRYRCNILFPFKTPFLLLAFSYFISSLFAIAGFGGALSRLVGNILEQLLLVYMIWKIVDTKDDFNYLIKGFSIVILISCIYCFFEYVTKVNPLMMYEKTLMSDASRAIDFSYDNFEEFRGFRPRSIFFHPIGAGVNWALYFCFIFTLFSIGYIKMQKAKMFIFVALLSLICVFLSNSRGPLLFLFIGSLAFINFKNKQRLIVMVLLLLFSIILLLPFLQNYTDTILSFFDSKAQEKVGGSNVDMRMEQLLACFDMINGHDFCGLGFHYENLVSSYKTQRLLGMESVWFSTIVETGIIGVLVKVIEFVFMIILVPLKFKSRPAFFFALAYCATYSATSLPGMLDYMFWCIEFMFIKLSPIYIKQNKLMYSEKYNKI